MEAVLQPIFERGFRRDRGNTLCSPGLRHAGGAEEGVWGAALLADRRARRPRERVQVPDAEDARRLAVAAGAAGARDGRAVQPVHAEARAAERARAGAGRGGDVRAGRVDAQGSPGDGGTVRARRVFGAGVAGVPPARRGETAP